MRPNSLNAFCWVFCEGGVTFNVPERKDGEMLTERFLGNISNISGNCGLFKVFWEGKTFQRFRFFQSEATGPLDMRIILRDWASLITRWGSSWRKFPDTFTSCKNDNDDGVKYLLHTKVPDIILRKLHILTHLTVQYPSEVLPVISSINGQRGQESYPMSHST